MSFFAPPEANRSHLAKGGAKMFFFAPPEATGAKRGSECRTTSPVTKQANAPGC